MGYRHPSHRGSRCCLGQKPSCVFRRPRQKSSGGRRSCGEASVVNVQRNQVGSWGFETLLAFIVFLSLNVHVLQTTNNIPGGIVLLKQAAFLSSQRELAASNLLSIWSITAFHMSISSWNWCFSGDAVVSTNARLVSICCTRARIRLTSLRSAWISSWRVAGAFCAVKAEDWAARTLTAFCWTAVSVTVKQRVQKMIAAVNRMKLSFHFAGWPVSASLYTTPPFMTKPTFSSARTSLRGSELTAIRSASFPASS